MRLLRRVPLVESHLDLEVRRVIRVNDRWLHAVTSALPDQVPKFGCLDDEIVQPVFDADEDPRRSGPRRVGQEPGWPIVEVVVQAQGRPPTERGDQVPDLMKHETFRVEILDLRIGRSMLPQDPPDGRHVITILAAGGSSANVGQKQHNGGGDHAILDLG